MLSTLKTFNKLLKKRRQDELNASQLYKDLVMHEMGNCANYCPQHRNVFPSYETEDSQLGEI